MQLGIKTKPEHTPWQELVDVWRAADDIDLFASAWNWDHFYPLSGDLTAPNYEAWTMLAAMAQATRRIRIGCQVTGMIYRHPAVLANMAATTDVISGGRLEIGLGAGWMRQECDAYGIELPPLRERFDRFDEGVQAIIGLLSQEVTDFAGTHVRLTGARCEPKPVQQPHPPIVIGGTGPKRTLRAAARWSQQWHAGARSPEHWRELDDVLRAHCADLGRDPAEITRSVNVRVHAETGVEPAVEQAAGYRDAGVDLVVFNLPHHVPAGYLDRLAEVARPLLD